MGPPSLNDMKDAFYCAICFNAFKKPKILPSCGHCFCYCCIQAWYKCDGATTGVLRCPICRTPVNLRQYRAKRSKCILDYVFRDPPNSSSLSKYLDDCLTAKLAAKLHNCLQNADKQKSKMFETVRSRLTCQICKFRLDDPRMLPYCQHSFCLSCLQMEYKQNDPDKGLLMCPVCNKTHRFEKQHSFRNKPPSVAQIGKVLPFDYVLSVLLETFPEKL